MPWYSRPVIRLVLQDDKVPEWSAFSFHSSSLLHRTVHQQVKLFFLPQFVCNWSLGQNLHKNVAGHLANAQQRPHLCSSLCAFAKDALLNFLCSILKAKFKSNFLYFLPSHLVCFMFCKNKSCREKKAVSSCQFTAVSQTSWNCVYAF